MSHFRSSFNFATGVSRGSLNWFPKHMNSGLKQMQAKLRSVDCVLEVHDARIPMSGRNPDLYQKLVGPKPHVLIMNKSDFITNEDRRIITNIYRDSVNDIIFTNCKDDQCPGIKKIVPVMRRLIENSNRFQRVHSKEYHSLIIGIPNVGKSSLINTLRSKNLKKGRALKVAPSAGVTKCVHEKVKISQDPVIFLFDSPGILQPSVSDIQTGMKLAACGNLPDHRVGLLLIADYILFTLNKHREFRYIHFAGLEEPTDCIATVLSSAAINKKMYNSVLNVSTNSYNLKPDLTVVAEKFITRFRNGAFGKIILDDLGANTQDYLAVSSSRSNFLSESLA